MMALDGKTIIKEEITDKDAYESAASANSTRRNKGPSSNGSISNSTANPSAAATVNKDASNGSTTANCTTASSAANSSSTNCVNSSSAVGRNCRTPDSPESAGRAVAPRSPMSPQMHHTLAPPQRPNRNASASPVVNGATTTTTPPPPLPLPPTQSSAAVAAVAAAAAAAAHVEQARVLGKIRKFFGSLMQLAQDLHPEVSDRIRALVISLATGGISVDEFRTGLQEAISLPLRAYVNPLLKSHVGLLQREINALARATNQTPLQYVTTNENSVIEFNAHGPPAEYSDIFVQIDTSQASAASNGNGPTPMVLKRRPSDNLMEQHHNGVQDWSDYMANAYPPPKRALLAHNAQLAAVGGVSGAEARVSAYPGQPSLYDYSVSGVAAAAAAAAAAASQSENSFSNLMEKAAANHRAAGERLERGERERERDRDERDLREAQVGRHVSGRPQLTAPVAAGGGGGVGASVAANGGALGGEEEWKNIHTMLNCISAMVDKTKRAITILQQRGVEPQPANYGEITPATLVEIRRQTEEKVVEFKRNAEEAVNQVKRQAVIEIQRAVVAAETRAADVMAQDRLRMEKFFVEMSRHPGAVERDLDNKSPSITGSQNSCWNCGRKATETCSGCNMARYCGAFCQHKDWEHHHQICGTPRSVELAAKHASQVIPLSASLRASLARSPPSSAAIVQSSQQQPQTSSNVTQANSLVPNGLGSK